MECAHWFWLYVALSTLLAFHMMDHCRDCRHLSIGSLSLATTIGGFIWGLSMIAPIFLELEPWPIALLFMNLCALALFQVCATLELIGHPVDRLSGSPHQ
jgi:hypothetical protein